MTGFLHNLVAKSRGTVARLVPRKPAPFETADQGWSVPESDFAREDLTQPMPAAGPSSGPPPSINEAPHMAVPEAVHDVTLNDAPTLSAPSVALAQGSGQGPNDATSAPVEAAVSPAAIAQSATPIVSRAPQLSPGAGPPAPQPPPLVAAQPSIINPPASDQLARPPVTDAMPAVSSGAARAPHSNFPPDVEQTSQPSTTRPEFSDVNEPPPPIAPPEQQADNRLLEAVQMAPPPPVLPAPTSAEVRSPQREPRPREPASLPPETTVVEVTIGQIDVQLDTPAPMAPAALGSEDRSLSLDAFLGGDRS